MKTFEEFINNLDQEDRKNFDNYSPVRGAQIFRMFYEIFVKLEHEPTYEEVNSLVICDKALKDILYKYFGVLEELMRNYIFYNFELETPNGKNADFTRFYKNKKIVFPKLINRTNTFGEIDELYEKFALCFADIVHLYEHYKINFLSLEKLKNVRELRNKVMHHKPLLVNIDNNWGIDKLRNSIVDLHDLLPKNYRNGLYKGLNKCIEKTKDAKDKCFQTILLKEL